MAFSLGHHGSTSGSEENEMDDDEKTKRRGLFIRQDMKRQLFSQPRFVRVLFLL